MKMASIVGPEARAGEENHCGCSRGFYTGVNVIESANCTYPCHGGVFVIAEWIQSQVNRRLDILMIDHGMAVFGIEGDGTAKYGMM